MIGSVYLFVEEMKYSNDFSSNDYSSIYFDVTSGRKDLWKNGGSI